MADRNILAEMAEKIVAMVESTNLLPWQQPWVKDMSLDIPRNAETQRHMNGINVWVLTMEKAIKGYRTNMWGTFACMKRLGGFVKKDQKSTPVVYPKMKFWAIPCDQCGCTDPKCIVRTGAYKRDKQWTRKVPSKHYGAKFLGWGYHNMFNLDQCGGGEIEAKVAEFVNAPDRPDIDRMEAGEGIAAKLVGLGCVIQTGESRAYYMPSTDTINMPASNLFHSSEEYYSTLFHEGIHWTGHDSRLNRGLTGWQSEDYSKEELVAEFGAAMLCGLTGIANERTNQNTASYIRTWADRIREKPEALAYGASQAEKAVKFILGDK